MNDVASTWVVSPSPHAHSGDSVTKIMLAVIIALLPALAAGIAFFGWDALRLTLICVATCVISEFLTRKIMKRDTGINDLSAVVTGILLALNLPPSLPGWMAVVGSLCAIVIAKQVYGGIGYNLFNPALVGRCVLLVSFPVAMTSWAVPNFLPVHLDATTMATPLGAWKTAWSNGQTPSGYFEMFTLKSLLVGNRPGCIGETSTLALLAGGAFLLWRRCISWHTPVAFIGSVALFAVILHQVDPVRNLPPLYHVLSGGIFLGALFMATDMVTTPVTGRGMFIFGLGCGIITMIIRKWGGYPEGVSFSILIMNSLTPLINRFTRPRVFGHTRKEKTT
jgi:electron transport complex protein RnfD